MSRLPALDLGGDTHVLVLTGAGVSAESGIPTFRDSGGLWDQYCLDDVATPEGFARDPRLVWRFYSERRAAGRRCEPNPGHHAIADLEARLGDRLLLVTQNIDGLHARAGSRRMVEIHGQLYRTRCARCDRPAFEDLEGYGEARPPVCERCEGEGGRGLLRPDVVWFGEMLDAAHFEKIDRFLRAASRGRLVFLAAGTSGSVFPACALVDQARQAGAETWLVNADPADNTESFHHFEQGPSGVLLPRLLGTRGAG